MPHRTALFQAMYIHLVLVLKFDHLRRRVCFAVGTFTTLAVKTDPNALRIDWTGQRHFCA